MMVNELSCIYVGFCSFIAAYVNGQRQGRIMEKPFCIGDCIARESFGDFVSENTPRFPPTLDVENEMKLALNSKETFQENDLAQKMKELGLQR